MLHSHSHSHTHSHHAIESVSTTLIVCIILNLLFVIAEAAIGFSYHSLGLLSGAGHNLSDIFSLLLSLFAIRMAARKEIAISPMAIKKYHTCLADQCRHTPHCCRRDSD